MSCRLLLVSASVLCATAASCGDGPRNEVTSLNEFLAATQRIACDQSVRCGGIGASERNRCYDLYNLLSDGPVNPQALVDKGDIAFDSGAAGRCLDALETVPCTRTSASLSDCDIVFRGALPLGAPCVIDEQCKDAYCTSNTAGCSGVCTAFPATGTACSVKVPCGPSDVCDPTSSKCVARLPAGAGCAATYFCARGLSCAQGKCASPGSVGTSCGLNTDCTSGTFCDQATKKCAAQLAEGAPCTAAGMCGDGLACAGLAVGGGSGTCRPWLDAGKACTPGAFGCPQDMTCDNTGKVCKGAGALGEMCTNGSCAADLYCNAATQKCAPLVGYGGACTGQGMSENPCAVGECEPTTKTCLVLCK